MIGHLSESNRRRRSTEQHRRSVRRRVANRVRILAIILGVVTLVGALLFLGQAVGTKALFPEGPWRMAFIYAGASVSLFVLGALLDRRGWFRRHHNAVSDATPHKSRKRKHRHARPPKMAQSQGKDGMVLVLVIVLLGVMSMLLMHLQHQALLTRRADEQILEFSRLRVAAADEIWMRIQGLSKKEEQRFDALDEPWTRMHEVDRPDGITTISRITDLNRYIDINNLRLPESFPGPNVTEDILIEALTHAGDFTPIERIGAVQDWIFDEPIGARGSRYYREQDPPYDTPGTWMHTWQELDWIYGFEPAYFERRHRNQMGRPFTASVTDMITIVPGPRRRPIPININTATPELLASLTGPAQESIARYIELARAERPFQSVDALIAHADPVLFAALRPFVDVRSTHFLVEAQAWANHRRIHVRALIERSASGDCRVLQWVSQ